MRDNQAKRLSFWKVFAVTKFGRRPELYGSDPLHKQSTNAEAISPGQTCASKNRIAAVKRKRSLSFTFRFPFTLTCLSSFFVNGRFEGISTCGRKRFPSLFSVASRLAFWGSVVAMSDRFCFQHPASVALPWQLGTFACLPCFRMAESINLADVQWFSNETDSFKTGTPQVELLMPWIDTNASRYASKPGCQITASSVKVTVRGSVRWAAFLSRCLAQPLQPQRTSQTPSVHISDIIAN